MYKAYEIIARRNNFPENNILKFLVKSLIQSITRITFKIKLLARKPSEMGGLGVLTVTASV